MILEIYWFWSVLTLFFPTLPALTTFLIFRRIIGCLGVKDVFLSEIAVIDLMQSSTRVYEVSSFNVSLLRNLDFR